MLSLQSSTIYRIEVIIYNGEAENQFLRVGTIINKRGMKRKPLQFRFRLSLFSLLICFFGYNLSSFAQTYTFTNCSATGRLGPTQAQVNTAYTSTNLAGIVTVSGDGIQQWTVPVSGLYSINAFGAQGGSITSPANAGGLGARMQGEFYLTAGAVLNILVGQKGEDLSGGNAGGGGGSFVWITGQSSPLIVAGGGGGGGYSATGVGGVTTTSGTSGTGATGAAGTNGNGANPGGGGWSSAGADFQGATCAAKCTGNTPGLTVGGASPSTTIVYHGCAGTSSTGDGGFGGGSGGNGNCTSSYGAGGGGGYSGGAGQTGASAGGGGGGSFNSGTNQTNVAATRTGDGEVIINTIATTPCAGKPNPGTVTPAGPIATTCPGSPVVLTTTGFSLLINLAFQWEESVNAGPWTPIAGATNLSYTATPITATQYRLIVTCTNTGDTAITNTVSITTNTPIPLPIPYFQDFETWVNGCGTLDLPTGGNWNNQPFSGDDSWRRNDQGASSGGWSNNSGGYSPPAVSPTAVSKSARFHSYMGTAGTGGSLDMYIDCSAPLGPKQLYFYHMNQSTGAIGTDSLNILLSPSPGAPFTQIAGFDTAQGWRRRSVALELAPGTPLNSNQAIVRFQVKRLTGDNNTDIGIDSVYVAGPCNGTPTAGFVTPGNNTNLCAGAVVNLTTVGTTMGGGLLYQWEQSTDGGANWVNAVGGSGSNTQFYTTPHLYDTIMYRMQVSCGIGGTPVTTPAVQINVNSPFYASIPYVENFELWQNKCAAVDIPDSVWASYPSIGSNAWRKYNQGNTAIWTSNGINAATGMYFPVSISGLYSARFHSLGAADMTRGNLDLLLDCSQQTGNKQLEFHYINPSGTDSLHVYYSTDGGFSFALLKSYGDTVNWTEDRLVLPSNTATTIVRFTGYSDNGTTDIGLDSVRVVEPCNGAVTAGILNNLTDACANASFLLYLTGNTQTAGLSYDWQTSTDNVNWTSTGHTGFNYTTSITQPTYFRVVVTCVASGQSDTTPSQLVGITPFYYCYCPNGATTASGADVGNVKIESLPGNVVKLDNGTTNQNLTSNSQANKTYTDFRYTLLPPTALYHDSTYRLTIKQINSASYTPAIVTVWIDTDRNAVFDPYEIYLQQPTSASSFPAQEVNTSFTIPNSLDTGITAMRVQVEEGTTPSNNPCGTYTGGETEDYLIRIFYPPCDGPSNPGTAYVTDTSSCIGYVVKVFDTSYEKGRSGLLRKWQQSPDGVSWADIAGSEDLDTLNHTVVAPVYFRMRLVCANPVKLDTTYSNSVSISINPPVSCYCFSQASGSPTDTSDIGSFLFENFVNNVGGPHLKNPEAYRMRTDYTRQPSPELWIDSTYSFDLYHIMRSTIHADAKITVFVDFDADLQYDIPQELVYTGYTASNNYVISGSFTVPSNALPDIPTGMRVILNNDVGPNVPSDQACGAYESGETEDYVVIIRSPQTSVSDVRKMGHFNLFPNPTSGKFTVSYTTKEVIEEATLTVTNVMGAKILEQQLGKRAGNATYHDELDLSNRARGVYFVELKTDHERMTRKVVVQ